MTEIVVNTLQPGHICSYILTCLAGTGRAVCHLKGLNLSSRPSTLQSNLLCLSLFDLTLVKSVSFCFNDKDIFLQYDPMCLNKPIKNDFMFVVLVKNGKKSQSPSTFYRPKSWKKHNMLFYILQAFHPKLLLHTGMTYSCQCKESKIRELLKSK